MGAPEADGSNKSVDAILNLARTYPPDGPLLGGKIKAKLFPDDENVERIQIKVFPKGGAATIYMSTGLMHIAGRPEIREMFLSKVLIWTSEYNGGVKPTEFDQKKKKPRWIV